MSALGRRVVGKHGHGRASSLSLMVSRIETSIVSRWYLLIMYSCHSIPCAVAFVMWADLVKRPEAHVLNLEKFLYANIHVDVQRL